MALIGRQHKVTIYHNQIPFCSGRGFRWLRPFFYILFYFTRTKEGFAYDYYFFYRFNTSC